MRLAGLLTALLLLWTSPVRAQDTPLHVHFISGSNEYESEASLRAYKEYLEGQYDVRVTASWVEDRAKKLPGIEHVPGADVLLVFARRMALPPAEMEVVRRHWEEGKPVVGIRTASHAFGEETNQVFDHDVLGGNYQGHFDDHPVQVENQAPGHPVLDGVEPFTSRKMYEAGDLAPDARVLQTGTQNGHTHPVTWVHRYEGGRMFYTSLGVPQDFRNESFRRMLTNAIFWTVSREGD